MTPRRTTKKRRSPCPVACTLDVLGDKWTLLVVRDLLLGKETFKEFSDSPEGIATNVLTERLDRLIEHGLVEQFPSTERAGRWHYRLTKKGRTLRPLLESVRDWGLANLPGTQEKLRARSD
ncbi:MAG: helix-turn-helix domain-containing protein [Planctomycetota bacterium]